MKRYIAKTRKRRGDFTCLRCYLRFAGRDAYDRHLVKYPGGAGVGNAFDWCHLPEEVGLVSNGGRWAVPADGDQLALDGGILARGGVPCFPRARRFVSDAISSQFGPLFDQTAAEPS